MRDLQQPSRAFCGLAYALGRLEPRDASGGDSRHESPPRFSLATQGPWGEA